MENKSKEEVLRDTEATRAEAQYVLKEAGEIWGGKNEVANAWRTTKLTCLLAQDRVVYQAQKTDKIIRNNIYSSLGIALGVGTILALIFTGKSSRKASR